jgi:predicted SprT family Zn-dependent metalloprotease
MLSVSGHEMIHLRQHLIGDREHHGPRFQRMAARVCAVHGFDPKIF